MFRKISDFFSGLPMTIVSGIFLLCSLALLITKNFVELNISPFLDPAWITIVISGLPAFVSSRIESYKATVGIKRIAYHRCNDCCGLYSRSICGGRSGFYYGYRGYFGR